MSRRWVLRFFTSRMMNPDMFCAGRFLKHGMDFHRLFGGMYSILSPFIAWTAKFKDQLFITAIYNIMGGNITVLIVACAYGTNSTQTHMRGDKIHLVWNWIYSPNLHHLLHLFLLVSYAMRLVMAQRTGRPKTVSDTVGPVFKLWTTQ